MEYFAFCPDCNKVTTFNQDDDDSDTNFSCSSESCTECGSVFEVDNYTTQDELITESTN